ncbi:uncharacterized protein LOC126842220 [Adelges cooleyi]|uniref:uncharacterized protein LOC126842220 n=1 Tax=Adelges cooleyi TaxID=133065 RepID=UPI00217FC0B4|nr:uncharacterized protein LOC126842220 [Adelges cooleyi]
MIAHNCIFLSLYLILIVNFVMIESTKKVSPPYYVSRTYSLFYVNTVNTLKTYNQQEIKFSEKEITTLQTPVQTLNDTKGRNIVFDKFYKKIEDIKCTCSLIIKSKLVHLTNILEGLRRGGTIEVALDELNVLKEEAGFMVLLFEKAKGKAGKWFWSYYFKIMAMIEYESNKNFFRETPFEEEELQSDITNYIEYCKNNKYFPKNKPQDDLVSKNPNVPINIFKVLQRSVIIGVHYADIMQHISIEYLYLKPLWDEHELLFAKITGSVVEWRPTIRRHAAEVNKTKEFIENREWISKPFGHLTYHKLIQQIISVRMYTCLWVMLVMFNKEMPKMDLLHLKLLYMESMRTIDTGPEFMPYTDTFYSDVVAEFRYAMKDNQNVFDSIITRISARVKEISVELNGCNSNGSDWISIDIKEPLTYAMILEFLGEFRHFFNLLKEKIKAVNYELALSIAVEGN